jgi:hypothetical protein
MWAAGSQRCISRFIPSHGTRPRWLRRDSAQCQRRATLNRRCPRAYRFLGTPKLRTCTAHHGLQPLPTPGTGRDKRGSLLITTNQLVTQWGAVFGDDVLAAAILDRLLHHSHTLTIQGDNYRLRQRKKAGLLGRAPRNDA